jgi:hypothetical protein
MKNALTAYTPTTPQSAYQMAQTLAQSGLLPNDINSPEKAFAIMAAGAELGIGPMTALRSIVMVKGKVTLSSELMLRLAVNNGVTFRWDETTTERAELTLMRPGFDPFTSAFSMDDAKRAQLAGRGPWKTYPANMLRARAISNAVRAYCPDLLTGVYHTGELDEPSGEPMIDVTPTPEPEPKRWDGTEQRRFFAHLKDLDGADEHAPPIAYKELAAWCEAHGRPRPSGMSEEQRAKMLDWLATDDGRVTYETWLGKQQDSEVIDVEPEPEQ